MFLTMLTISVCYANIEIMYLLIMIYYQRLAQSYIGTKMNYMQANTEKFTFIIFDKERQQRTLQLNHNVTIQSVSNVKLLDVNIDVELNFNQHIALLCNKAGRQINALTLLSNVPNVDTKILTLQSFILLHFMYCCIIRHFCSIVTQRTLRKCN